MLKIYNEVIKYPDFHMGFGFTTWLKFLKNEELNKEEEDMYLPTDKAISFTKYIERYKGLFNLL